MQKKNLIAFNAFKQATWFTDLSAFTHWNEGSHRVTQKAWKWNWNKRKKKEKKNDWVENGLPTYFLTRDFWKKLVVGFATQPEDAG